MKVKSGYLLFGLVLLSAHSAMASKGAAYSPSPEPQVGNTWTVGATALYVQPSYSQTPVYGSVGTIQADAVTTYENYAVDSEYNWGYAAFLRYNFVDSHRDITLSYQHFSSTETDSVNLGALNTNYAYTQFFHTAEGKVFSSVDNAELVAGQWLRLRNDLALKVSAGVEYARIEQDFTSTYDKGFTSSATARPGTVENTSQFNGAGPKLGLNADYRIYESDFGVVGGLAGALLVGSLDHGNSTLEAGLVDSIFEDNDYDASTLAVTHLNANLGLRYDHAFQDQSLYLELGYEVDQYLDAVYVNNDVTFSGFYLNLAVSFL